MAESADALDSGSSRGNSVEVQVLLSAPNNGNTFAYYRYFLYFSVQSKQIHTFFLQLFSFQLDSGQIGKLFYAYFTESTCTDYFF